jgi:peptide/nickel transport system permease protein
VLITIAFGVAGAILTESSLSFLGIGVAPEQVTWGSLLSAARGYAPAWWLAIFPGFAIFITVTIFNLIGEGLTDAMDPRLKQ